MTHDDIDVHNLRTRALAAHFSVSESEVFDDGRGAFTIESEPGEYEVLTDDEANERWEEALDSYLEDCILCELPTIAQQYFDREAWKRDARHDGRAHAISSYDGNEYEYKISGTWLYVYRTN